MAKGSQVKPDTLELGMCKNGCGKQVVVAMQKGVPLSHYKDEEFCSAVCAKEFHGVPTGSTPSPKQHTSMINPKEEQ